MAADDTAPGVPTPVPASVWRRWRDRLLLQEGLNFLLTNRVPRLALTRFMGWFSKIEQPLVCRASIALWRACTEIDLSEMSSGGGGLLAL